MNFSQKNIVFGILFLLGILFTYSIFIQSSNTLSNIELASEENSTSNCIISDSDIQDHDQNLNNIENFSVFTNYPQLNHFHNACLLGLPFFSIWQPPKLS